MKTLFGEKTSFAIAVGMTRWPFCEVEIWVAGVNLSAYDSSAYLPAFISSVAYAVNSLKERLNFLEFEDRFYDLSLQAAFSWVESEVEPTAWAKLRVIDFGPTTDDYLCFLLPVRGKLYLSCRGRESDLVTVAQVLPHDLIMVFIAVLAELSKCNPGSTSIDASARLLE
jgi:hypothetical protein